MASVELTRRVEKAVGCPPLIELSTRQRRELREALLDADALEDLPGKWQAAILAAEKSPAPVAPLSSRR
jgi:hypothetical protein